MATSSGIINLHRLSHRSISSPSPSFPPPSLPRCHTRFLLVTPRNGRCFAVAPGPPSPPGPEPPPPRNTNDITGLAITISRIQDRVKIFFAVLFWMSLFFWASASDGRGNSKKKKGSRFK